MFEGKAKEETEESLFNLDKPNKSGGHSATEPPVPIPNTEVKCSNADGSATNDCARVGHRQA